MSEASLDSQVLIFYDYVGGNKSPIHQLPTIQLKVGQLPLDDATTIQYHDINQK